MKRWAIFFLISIILIGVFAQTADALTLSPTELRIKNTDRDKTYQFIVLVSNQELGFVDVELRASDPSLSISPDRFMLNEGEKKSVRVSFRAKNIDKEKNKLLIQPFVNTEPSTNKLTIFLEESDSRLTPDIQEETGIRTVIKEPEFIKLVIYGLLFIVATLIILIFTPEIKKNMQNVKNKTNKITKRQKEKTIKKRIQSLEKKVERSSGAIDEIINKVEKFHEQADSWLKKESNGKYGL